MPRLRAALGGGPRLLVKRDDAIPFGFGGNKVRKLEFVLAQAHGPRRRHARHARRRAVESRARDRRRGGEARTRVRADHQRTAARSTPPRTRCSTGCSAPRSSTSRRATSAPEASERVMARLRAEGRRPFFMPLGASTPIGALGFVAAIGELIGQGIVPDVIVHAGSSGGTQAGLVAGVALCTA